MFEAPVRYRRFQATSLRHTALIFSKIPSRSEIEDAKCTKDLSKNTHTDVLLDGLHNITTSDRLPSAHLDMPFSEACADSLRPSAGLWVVGTAGMTGNVFSGDSAPNSAAFSNNRCNHLHVRDAIRGATNIPARDTKRSWQRRCSSIVHASIRA